MMKIATIRILERFIVARAEYREIMLQNADIRALSSISAALPSGFLDQL